MLFKYEGSSHSAENKENNNESEREKFDINISTKQCI